MSAHLKRTHHSGGARRWETGGDGSNRGLPEGSMSNSVPGACSGRRSQGGLGLDAIGQQWGAPPDGGSISGWHRRG
jgi:hypothetical protein